MNTRKNGETQKDRKRSTRNDSDQLRGLGGVQVSSRYDGTDSLRVNTSDCSGQDSARPSFDGNTPFGKILQRLKLIEEAHLTYVHSHRQRLEARLEENKESEESFRQQVAELEQEIYKLATQASDDSVSEP
ncbi:hypothetical protein [Halotia branconii]|uniref:Uncharacterized protein n=1 Tax=Halotia branconii CENA392 TaxID=1539056 RepID=A0AAJ6NMT6_9CYAN|nr:hypothetical protein [Halotia branconii]WGV23360.1 hypothetical protein QI031_16160 [Halotia branconii CENA392]